MPKITDWVKQTVTGTPGTGTISLGDAVSGYIRCQDDSSLTTGSKILFSVLDGANRSIEEGTLTSGSPWTLSRDKTWKTLIAGTFDDTSPATMSLTSSAIIGMISTAESSGIVAGYAINSTTSIITCSTILPFDNTIPQNTEGTQVITVDYTPKFSDSILQIQGFTVGRCDGTNSFGLAAAIFKDTTANGIYMTCIFPGYAPSSGSITSSYRQLVIYHEEVSSNTTLRTYKLRIGPVATGTYYVNGDGTGAAVFAGLSKAWLKVTEIRQ